MPEPATNPVPSASLKLLTPWVVFAVILLAAIAGFFLYANRVPSLLQALTER